MPKDPHKTPKTSPENSGVGKRRDILPACPSFCLFLFIPRWIDFVLCKQKPQYCTVFPIINPIILNLTLSVTHILLNSWQLLITHIEAHNIISEWNIQTSLVTVLLVIMVRPDVRRKHTDSCELLRNESSVRFYLGAMRKGGWRSHMFCSICLLKATPSRSSWKDGFEHSPAFTHQP